MEAPIITPLKNERAYKRGNGGQIIANNQYTTEFRTKYFLYRNARYAALTGGRRKDFGWYVLLKTMWPEWLKEGLTEISPIPARMELDYLFRMDSKIRQAADSSSRIDHGSAKRGQELASHLSIIRNITVRFKLIPFPRCSCAVRGRRDNPEAPAVSHPRLQRHRCPGLRCDRCGPSDRRVATPRSG